ncbi:MAG: hypothetical protein QME60_05830, partial [Verrucomicrobiota bacterium]|nr:hypothetical protein [Verrucomicrobiota bacterium]
FQEVTPSPLLQEVSDITEAKTRSPATRAIMLTGFGAIMNDEGNYPKGVDSILSKPLTRQEMRRAIAEVMAGREGARRHT